MSDRLSLGKDLSEVEELVCRNPQSIHIERLDDGVWFIGIDDSRGGFYQITATGHMDVIHQPKDDV